MGENKVEPIKWTDYNKNNKPLTDIQVSIMNFVAEKDAVFIQEIVTEFGVSTPTVYNAVNRLYRAKLIKRVEIKPGGLYIPSALVNRIAEIHKTKQYPAGKLKYFHWITLNDGVKKDADFEGAIDE
jgi:predicted DNA-binding transcriptional regulator